MVQSASLSSQPPVSNSPLASAFLSQPNPLPGTLPTTLTMAQSTFANFTGVMPTHPTTLPGLTSGVFVPSEVHCMMYTKSLWTTGFSCSVSIYSKHVY